MRNSWATLVLVAVVLFTGCAGSAPPSADGWHDGPGGANHLPLDGDLPKAAPEFAAHFTHGIYEDPTNEFAPFGSDEGWDLLHEWAEQRDQLEPSTTLADLIEASGFADVVAEFDSTRPESMPDPGGQVDAATVTIGAGFTLLRLTGHIDEDGRQQTLKALDILIRYYDAPVELVRQRADLTSWTG